MRAYYTGREPLEILSDWLLFQLQLQGQKYRMYRGKIAVLKQLLPFPEHCTNRVVEMASRNEMFDISWAKKVVRGSLAGQ